MFITYIVCHLIEKTRKSGTISQCISREDMCHFYMVCPLTTATIPDPKVTRSLSGVARARHGILGDRLDNGLLKNGLLGHRRRGGILLGRRVDCCCDRLLKNGSRRHTWQFDGLRDGLCRLLRGIDCVGGNVHRLRRCYGDGH